MAIIGPTVPCVGAWWSAVSAATIVATADTALCPMAWIAMPARVPMKCRTVTRNLEESAVIYGDPTSGMLSFAEVRVRLP